jgi:hypothetical protein
MFEMRTLKDNGTYWFEICHELFGYCYIMSRLRFGENVVLWCWLKKGL